MAFKTYSGQVEQDTAAISLITAATNDSLLFTRTAVYGAYGVGSHVVSFKRAVTIGVDGVLASANGATLFGVANTGTTDLRVGASGAVTANGGNAIDVGGTDFTLYNRGEISGAAGVHATTSSVAITNAGAISGRIAIDLTATGASVDNSGDIVGTGTGLRINGSGGGQQVDNSGHISGGRGTGIDIHTDGDVLIANSGTISAAIGINLDVASATDTGTRSVTNTGTITGSTYAVFGSAGDDTVLNDGHLAGGVNLYAGDDLYDGREGTASGAVGGGDGNDILIGAIDTRNVLSGGAGYDELTGGDGNDLLIGGAGENLLDGGAGFDIASYRDASDYVVVQLDGFSSEDDTLVSIEGLEGSAFNDVLVGDDARNRLIGGAGNDQMNGGGGPDVLVGGIGDDEYFEVSFEDTIVERANGGYDTIHTDGSISTPLNVEVLSLEATTGTQNGYGNVQDNIILGSVVANVIDGYEGRDTLTGGGGKDTFRLTTAPTSSNVDTITDFLPGTDKIALAKAIFAGIGTVSNSAITPGSFHAGTSAQEADDRIIYDGASGNLFYDADGNGSGLQVQIAHLNGNPLLTAADLIVY